MIVIAMIASVVDMQPAAARSVGTPVAARLLAAPATASLPSERLHFGLANPPRDFTWMTSSRVPWKYRYQYLSGGVNTGTGWETWNVPPGAFASFYMSDSATIGAIPLFTYYELLQSLPSTGSTELDRDYSNLNNASTMKAYYTNFALLMNMAKVFGKPVVVHVEPDLFAYMEQKAAGGDASTVSASVASSGYTGFSALPNTFQGFSWGLLKLRDTIAPNVVMATHASTWASGVDIVLNTDATFNLAANADKVAAFLSSAGIAANPQASTFDVVFNDLADNDAGITQRWWDRLDMNLPDFQQWLTWMTELHARTARPLVVWQVPVGNQYFDTMNQSPGHTQDNRAEYFLSHVSALQAAGIIAVLFGSGGNGGSTYTDAKGDGVTNPPPVSTFECNLCNTHTSVWSDDDGGFLRIFVGAYYATTPTTPTVSSVVPNSGPAAGGTSVIIAGTNFTAATAVKFGAASATTYTVNSATQIGVTSPPGSGVVDVTVTTANGTSATSSADSFTYLQPPGRYHSLSPQRILDTRTSVGGHLGPLGPQGTMTVQITGQGGIPSTGVSAVTMNVTVTNTTTPSFLTIYPAGVPRPLASNLNWVAGQTVPNLVEVAVGANGNVTAFNGAGSTDVIFDVAGYVSAPAAAPGTDGLYTPLVPARLLDTRTGNGGFSAPVGPGQTINLQVGGRSGSGIPASGVSAVVLNVTATGATAASYLTVYPMGASQPLASNLNFVAGQTVPNRVIVKVGINPQTTTSGWVSIYNALGSVNVIADVGGWFTDGTDPMATGAAFVGMTPTRLIDTRNGRGPIGAAGTLVLPISGVNGVPTTAKAVVLNVTVTNPTAPSFLTVWPDGATQPLASDLNYVVGLTVPNLVVVKLGISGAVDFYNGAGSADVVVDVVGWYG